MASELRKRKGDTVKVGSVPPSGSKGSRTTRSRAAATQVDVPQESTAHTAGSAPGTEAPPPSPTDKARLDSGRHSPDWDELSLAENEEIGDSVPAQGADENVEGTTAPESSVSNESPSDSDQNIESAITPRDELRATLQRVFEKLRPLPEAVACTNFGGTKRARDVPTMDVRYEFDDDLHTLKRIYQIAGSRGSRLIENLALADPQDYTAANGYIKKRMPPEIGHFYLVGTVTLSSLSTGKEKANRQLCVRLMWESAPRALSFIGIVIRHRFLYVPSFSNGVTFSSMVYREQQKVSDDVPGKTVFGPTRPRSRFTNNVQGYIPPGVDVPIYDGREASFKMSDYTTSLERYHGEISNDTAVIVTFTVGWYENKPEKRPANDNGFVFDTAVSLNIKSVIMVADSPHDYTEMDLPDEPLWAVEPLSTGPVTAPVVVVEDGVDEEF